MPNGSRSRLHLWLVAVAASVAACALYAHSFSSFDEWTPLRSLSFLLIGVGMIGIVFIAPAWRSRKLEAGLLITIAVVLRIILLPTPASDDVHRYLWEGKLVSEGVSPYSLRGDHPDLETYRDKQWEQMNNKDKATAYPPGSLLIFAGIGELNYSIAGFKVAFIIVDLLTIGVLLYGLHLRTLPLRHVAFYAFNPVVLISFAGEAHFDVLMLLPLAAAALLVDRRAWILAGCALAIATQIKLITLLSLPLLLWKGQWRAGIGFLTTNIAISLPFLSSLPQLYDAVYQFGANRDFNGFPNLFGNLLNLDRENLHRPLQIGFAACFLWRWIRFRGKEDWHPHWIWIVGALLLLAPTVHFWYLSWIAISLVFAPSLFWVCLSLTQSFYFFVWKDYAESGIWDLYDYHSALLWAPALLLGIPYLLQSFQSIRFRPQSIDQAPSDPSDDSFLIVIPTLNAANTLRECLDSVMPQLRPQDKIIICDAGSTDDTVAIAKQKGITTISSDRGRGTQIANGLMYSHSRYALILHADSLTQNGTIPKLAAYMKKNPHCSGGSLGQRFATKGLFPYRLVEILNEFRSTLMGISFGDQLQFFDRAQLPNNRFPAQPLMEDIELSLRLRDQGSLAYLAIESETNPSKWKRQAPLRFILVLRLVAIYSIQRLINPRKANQLSYRLYDFYYGK